MEVFRKVHRNNLKRFQVGRIGKGTQGDIVKICVDGRLAVVKDISNRNLPSRVLFARWLLAREYRAYLRLQGLAGIPKLFGKIDRDAFILEYIDGVPLSAFSRDAHIPVEFFDTLTELVQGIHSRGVVHSDLKHKKNILVGKDARPYLIDFGTSWIVAPAWNFPHRWLYRQFLQIDLNAISKIRTRFVCGSPDASDLKNLRKRNIMEKCGTVYQFIYRIFSRKHSRKMRRKTSSSRALRRGDPS